MGSEMCIRDRLYTRLTRATKYGILFIGLTFMTLFIFEVSIRQRIHLLQYALIGVSLSLFYLVLLSLSEHVKFIVAYCIASAITVTMISVYTGCMLRSAVRAAGIATLLTGLYGLLYVLLRLEDYALLGGTAVLLSVCLLYTSPSPRDGLLSRMPSSA